MTLSDRDLSNYDGSPVILYEFSRRSTPTISGVEIVTYWRYTSADRDIVLDAHTYTAIPMTDDGVRQTADTAADTMTFKMPATEAVPQMFVGSPPSDPINALIRRTHYGETEAFNAWAGTVAQVNRPDDATAEVLCNTLSATLDRKGLRLSFTRGCPHDLYGFECRASPLIHYVSGPVTFIAGPLINCDAFGTLVTSRLAGGWVEWLDTYGHAERRAVLAHADSTVRVLGVADRLAIGDTIWAFHGCKHNTEDCETGFNNLANYGGHIYMPDKNPFSGDIIF